MHTIQAGSNRLFGLVVWFSLWVWEVLGSIPRTAPFSGTLLWYIPLIISFQFIHTIFKPFTYIVDRLISQHPWKPFFLSRLQFIESGGPYWIVFSEIHVDAQAQLPLQWPHGDLTLHCIAFLLQFYGRHLCFWSNVEMLKMQKQHVLVTAHWRSLVSGDHNWLENATSAISAFWPP